MKKIAIFFTIIIIIVVSIAILVINYQNKQQKIKQENEYFENYLNKEIYGTELATLINKTIDINTKNGIQQDNNKRFISNDDNSINIDIKMIDRNKTYPMEVFYNSQIQNFVSHYNIITFKCTKIDYHNTGRVKYLLFEQVTK